MMQNLGNRRSVQKCAHKAGSYVLNWLRGTYVRVYNCGNKWKCIVSIVFLGIKQKKLSTSYGERRSHFPKLYDPPAWGFCVYAWVFCDIVTYHYWMHCNLTQIEVSDRNFSVVRRRCCHKLLTFLSSSQEQHGNFNHNCHIISLG